MRIVSLVPSATEMLFALGVGDQVCGVTHECDYPYEASELPHVTRSVIDGPLSAGEIDRAVRELTGEGKAIYELDEELLVDLKPDLIVTQALCAVCAVSYDDVRVVADRIPTRPEVISLDPNTFGEVIADIRHLATATSSEDEAEELIDDIARRVDLVQIAVAGADRVRVVALEWLDPVYVAGHWTPQLIEYAGGEDFLGRPAEKSEVVSWEEVQAAQPEIVVVMPCGYNEEQSLAEAERHRSKLESLGASKIVAVDAAAYFSRPGPRLIDGLELLASILHPERILDAESKGLELQLDRKTVS